QQPRARAGGLDGQEIALRKFGRARHDEITGAGPELDLERRAAVENGRRIDREDATRGSDLRAAGCGSRLRTPPDPCRLSKSRHRAIPRLRTGANAARRETANRGAHLDSYSSKDGRPPWSVRSGEECPGAVNQRLQGPAVERRGTDRLVEREPLTWWIMSGNEVGREPPHELMQWSRLTCIGRTLVAQPGDLGHSLIHTGKQAARSIQRRARRNEHAPWIGGGIGFRFAEQAS